MTGRAWGAIALVSLAGLALWWWPTDTRRIVATTRELAQAASIPASEPDLARLTRAATLARLLAPDFELGRADLDRVVSGRETAVGLATRLRPPRGLDVTVGEPTVDVASDRLTATARAVLTLRELGASGQPEIVEERMASTDWVKSDRWVLRRLTVSAPVSLSGP